MDDLLRDILDTPPNAAWQNLAACAAAPDVFLNPTPEDEATAQLICRRCPVQRDCLDYALEHDERFGVWGGLNVRERRRLRRLR